MKKDLVSVSCSETLTYYKLEFVKQGRRCRAVAIQDLFSGPNAPVLCQVYDIYSHPRLILESCSAANLEKGLEWIAEKAGKQV